MSEWQISRYKGVRLSDFPRSKDQRIETEELDIIIVTGKPGECEGCGEEKLIRLWVGSWLCNRCIVEDLKDELYQEGVELQEYEVLEGK